MYVVLVHYLLFLKPVLFKTDCQISFHPVMLPPPLASSYSHLVCPLLYNSEGPLLITTGYQPLLPTPKEMIIIVALCHY